MVTDVLKILLLKRRDKGKMVGKCTVRMFESNNSELRERFLSRYGEVTKKNK